MGERERERARAGGAKRSALGKQNNFKRIGHTLREGSTAKKTHQGEPGAAGGRGIERGECVAVRGPELDGTAAPEGGAKMDGASDVDEVADEVTADADEDDDDEITGG